jgi:hypothetical protein
MRGFLDGNLMGAWGTDFKNSPGVDTWKLEAREPSGSSAEPGVWATLGHRPWPPTFPRRLVSGPLWRSWVSHAELRLFALVVGPWILMLPPDSLERCWDGFRVCFLALEVCLGCHVGPSILVLSCDWSMFYALNSKVCFPSISAQIPA